MQGAAGTAPFSQHIHSAHPLGSSRRQMYARGTVLKQKRTTGMSSLPWPGAAVRPFAVCPCPKPASASCELLQVHSWALLHRAVASDRPHCRCACHAAHKRCTASPRAHTLPSSLHTTSAGSVPWRSASTAYTRRRHHCTDTEALMAQRLAPAAAYCKRSRCQVQGG